MLFLVDIVKVCTSFEVIAKIGGVERFILNIFKRWF